MNNRLKMSITFLICAILLIPLMFLYIYHLAKSGQNLSYLGVVSFLVIISFFLIGAAIEFGYRDKRRSLPIAIPIKSLLGFLTFLCGLITLRAIFRLSGNVDKGAQHPYLLFSVFFFFLLTYYFGKKTLQVDHDRKKSSS